MQKGFIVLLLPLFLLTSTHAQVKDKYADNYAKNLLKKQKHFLSHNLDSSFFYGNNLLNYSRKKKNERYYANACYYLANAFSRIEEYDSSMFYAKISLKYDLQLHDSVCMVGSYNLVGILHKDLTQYDSALYYFFKSYNISARNKDSSSMVSTNMNIGSVFVSLKNYKKALEYFREAERLALREDKGNNLGGTYSNIALCMDYLGDIKESLKYYKKSFHFFKSINDTDGMANELNAIAGIYYYKQQYDSCLILIKQSIDMYLQIHDSLNATTKAINYASLLLEMKQPQKAVEVLENYKRIAMKFVDKSYFINYLDVYSQVLFTLKRYDEAFSYRLKIENLKDSIFAATNTKNLLETEAKFNNAKQRLENLKLKNDKEIADQKNAKLNTYIWSAVIVGFILFLFVLFFFRSSKQKQKSNLQLLRLNSKLESSKKEIESQNHLLEEKQKEITDSINYAKRIQYSLLAHDELLNHNLPQHFVLFNPKDIVSGDFYWATNAHDSFYLAVCDSTGHGVPGAFMSLLNISYLNEAVIEKNIIEPNAVLNHVRLRLINSMEGAKDGMDGTLIRFEKNKITYASAHNHPVLIRNNQIIELGADKMPIGKGELQTDFTLFTADLQKNDMLYFYTDGYADQFGGPKGKKFKYQNLNELLLKLANENLKTIQNELEQSFSNWKGDLEQVDDVCVIGIRI